MLMMIMKRIRHTSVLRSCLQTSLCLEDNEVVQKKEEKERSLGLGKGHHSLSGGSFARHWDCKSFLKKIQEANSKIPCHCKDSWVRKFKRPPEMEW